MKSWRSVSREFYLHPCGSARELRAATSAINSVSPRVKRTYATGARTSSGDPAAANGQHALVPRRCIRKPHFRVSKRARGCIRGNQQLDAAERGQARRPEAEVVVGYHDGRVRGVVRPLRNDHARGSLGGEAQAGGIGGQPGRALAADGIDAAHHRRELQDADEHERCEGEHEHELERG